MDVTSRVIREVMSKIVIGVEPGMSVRDALGLATEHGVSHLPVVSDGQPLGVVCACELREAPESSDVSAVMHSPPASVRPDQTFREAIRVMAELHVGSVLVLSNQEIVGILTRTDVERAGLARAAFGDRHCARCGTYQHVRAVGSSGTLLCWHCRSSSSSG